MDYNARLQIIGDNRPTLFYNQNLYINILYQNISFNMFDI